MDGGGVEFVCRVKRMWKKQEGEEGRLSTLDYLIDGRGGSFAALVGSFPSGERLEFCVDERAEIRIQLILRNERLADGHNSSSLTAKRR
jgi:hypothetical protein